MMRSLSRCSRLVPSSLMSWMLPGFSEIACSASLASFVRKTPERSSVIRPGSLGARQRMMPICEPERSEFFKLSVDRPGFDCRSFERRGPALREDFREVDSSRKMLSCCWCAPMLARMSSRSTGFTFKFEKMIEVSPGFGSGA